MRCALTRLGPIMLAALAALGGSRTAIAGPAVVVDGTSQPPIDPVWRVDIVARGVASVATTTVTGGAPGAMRSGLAPALALRVEHRFGPLDIGGTLAAAIPAWAGQLDAAVSVDHAHAVTRRWSLVVGGDAGASVYYYDAGVGDSAPADVLRYWGPFARVRAQLQAMWTQPNGRAIGVVTGPTLAVTWAHAFIGEDTYGARLEPGLELGLTMRL